MLRAANLSGANLYDANLANADLVGADLSGAILLEAKLVEANLANIKNWRDIKSIENANIYEVKNPPDGFIDWAKDHGAVEIEDEKERKNKK